MALAIIPGCPGSEPGLADPEALSEATEDGLTAHIEAEPSKIRDDALRKSPDAQILLGRNIFFDLDLTG